MEHLSVHNFSNSYFNEYLTPEVTTSNKKGCIFTLYKSPSQASDAFDSFIRNLEKLVIDITSFDPHLVMLFGDLTHFSPMSHFYTPKNVRKPMVF